MRLSFDIGRFYLNWVAYNALAGRQWDVRFEELIGVSKPPHDRGVCPLSVLIEPMYICF
jgi:hypothetical protein